MRPPNELGFGRSAAVRPVKKLFLGAERWKARQAAEGPELAALAGVFPSWAAREASRADPGRIVSVNDMVNLGWRKQSLGCGREVDEAVLCGIAMWKLADDDGWKSLSNRGVGRSKLWNFLRVST